MTTIAIILSLGALVIICAAIKKTNRNHEKAEANMKAAWENVEHIEELAKKLR